VRGSTIKKQKVPKVIPFDNGENPETSSASISVKRLIKIEIEDKESIMPSCLPEF
jgi:hypothetical protein